MSVILYSEFCLLCRMWIWMHCKTESLLWKVAYHRLLLNLLILSPDGMMKSVVGKRTSHGTNFWKMHLSQCSPENLFHMELLNIQLFCSPLHREHLVNLWKLFCVNMLVYHAWVLTLYTYICICLILSFLCLLWCIILWWFFDKHFAAN